jgi:tritrans,polycis-undecaprenyl-diphosphate synthase [geranylgeranyl-diphosphate specific]
MNKPLHVGIIMDGNRRFAKALNLSPWKGHEYGEKKILELLKWSKELDIKEITVYAFSIQNMNRPKKEFEYLMKLFLEFSEKALKNPEFKKSGIKISILGDTSLFPEKVNKKIQEIVQETKNNNKYYFNVAIGYGGREEIIRAVKKIAQKVKNNELKPEEITEQTFANNLYLNSEPDLIIRTGGEKRTSNFLPWQSTYSEWFFLDKKWPEFTKQDLINCLEEYSKRERRFGK